MWNSDRDEVFAVAVGPLVSRSAGDTVFGAERRVVPEIRHVDLLHEVRQETVLGPKPIDALILGAAHGLVSGEPGAELLRLATGDRDERCHHFLQTSLIFCQTRMPEHGLLGWIISNHNYGAHPFSQKLLGLNGLYIFTRKMQPMNRDRGNN